MRGERLGGGTKVGSGVRRDSSAHGYDKHIVLSPEQKKNNSKIFFQIEAEKTESVLKSFEVQKTFRENVGKKKRRRGKYRYDLQIE